MNKKTLVGLIITFLALLGSLFVLINAGVIKLPEKKDNTPAEEVVVVEPDENEKKKGGSFDFYRRCHRSHPHDSDY